jgi:hypothetical protein
MQNDANDLRRAISVPGIRAHKSIAHLIRGVENHLVKLGRGANRGLPAA